MASKSKKKDNNEVNRDKGDEAREGEKDVQQRKLSRKKTKKKQKREDKGGILQTGNKKKKIRKRAARKTRENKTEDKDKTRERGQ
ncbi:hypothetical protein CCP4SC76_5960002 [Gammaproteobacteria bacterium]